MITVKNLAATCAIAWGLTLYTANAAAEVSPVVGSFGNPSLGQDYLEAYRTPEGATWYVTFGLDVDRYVTLGAQPLTDSLPDNPDKGLFNVTGLNLYKIAENGTPPVEITPMKFVESGTTDIEHNPFAPQPIEHIVADLHSHPVGLSGIRLEDGIYALAVSGNGNRSLTGDSTEYWNPPNDLKDFGVHIQVAAIPEPETYALMLAGLGLVGFAARRRLRTS